MACALSDFYAVKLELINNVAVDVNVFFLLHRGAHIAANMIASSKEIATKVGILFFWLAGYE